MAKETRTIINSVRVGKRVFSEKGIFEGGKLLEGDAHDELARALTGEQTKRLTEKGSIAGFVKTPEAPKGKEK